MKNNEILKLANLTTKSYNKVIEDLKEDDILDDDSIINYITCYTPFLKNWLAQNINKVLPDCMEISHYQYGILYIADSYDYPSDCTECDIENSLDEGKSIINYSIASEITGTLMKAYPNLNFFYVLELIEERVDMYYTIYHSM